ncbi:hypothetical protein RO3G_00644 [Lichtheimia corymbifera JMRC:FSU:9682]|uniref:Uncharacterized protein n=1 Tax=Lichtheimia corymbifera JMRC:FSU:9682 TaxID=1263082 RepID=A0A068S9T1_9FUNG|nr:hypothetical protein RO3G_00644 [Lichtheimia corymbifera JMRC:FSU:9682]
MTPDFTTLERRCTGQVCHCDWRLTIRECEEAKAMWYIHIVNIAVSGFAAVLCIIALSYRMFYKKEALWGRRPGTGAGFLRPKPINTMLLLGIFFNGLRMTSSAVIVSNVLPSNYAIRLFVFDVAWQFGYGAIVLYLVGVSQVIKQTVNASGWMPSARFVDVIGCTLFLTPFIVNNCVSVLAGVFADTHVRTATILIRLLYFVWFVECTENHRKLKNIVAAQHMTAIRAGVAKIRAQVIILSVALALFAIALILEGVLRSKIMSHTIGNVAISVPWMYIGSLTTFAFLFAILISPTDIMQNPAFASLRKTSKDLNTARNMDDLEAQRQHQPSTREPSSILSGISKVVDPDECSTVDFETPTRDRNSFITATDGEKSEKAVVEHMDMG